MEKSNLEMNMSKQAAERRKQLEKELKSQFKNPIIHKAIKSDEVYVPLKVEKLWG
ncbi:hypothetical protein M3212_11230 [Alkalihalobacillus oceani]|uniref:hypothetical protein n=1 Tax=Halalkalibacter oceani TaxID=1653776 RepID=UPI00203D6982|nr:hypothetical protein [Halalkalibacter oceani]MCM3761355.1 hypothetical protein [Halalkalibacter oceani]